MDAFRDFAKAVVTPAIGVVSLVSAILGFSGADVGEMTTGLWLAIGYVALALFAVRIWWDQRQRALRAEGELDRLTSDVHGGVSSQIEVQRIVSPMPLDDLCLALSFGLLFRNNSDCRVHVRIVRAGFTLKHPTTNQHEADVAIVNTSADFTLRPHAERWFNADYTYQPPRQLPGWIDGDGFYEVEYGAQNAEQRFRLRSNFRWRNHPQGSTDYILPGLDAVKDEPL